MTANAYTKINSNQCIEYKSLTAINELTNKLLDSLDTINMILTTMQNNVSQMDNNCITTEYNHSLTIYNASRMNDTKNVFINFKNNIENIIEYNNANCVQECHKWLYDVIDITPDKSQPIIYCEYCEITK